MTKFTRITTFCAMLFVGGITPAIAQNPITVRVVELTDSVRFNITWAEVSGAQFYDLGTFSNPRVFDTEQVRTVTGVPSWTVTALRANLKDSLVFYVNIRTITTAGTILPAKYAAITYRIPRPQTPTGVIIKETIPPK